jgi:ABC-2 type transport system permease protein
MTTPAAARPATLEALPRGFLGPGLDPARARGNGFADTRRAFLTATRLGWLLEANWTDPVLFFIYSVAKPLASVLILVFMVNVISGGGSAGLRAFVVVGSSLWSFVFSGVAGLGVAILDDRERYRMLRYVFVSPSDFIVVILGRGVARVAVGLAGAVISLAVGIVFLGVDFDPGRIDWPVLAVAMALGLWAVVAIGVLIAAVCIQTRQESWQYPEAVAGALFLVSGAVFPLSVLPAFAQALGLISPLSWWMEGVRRALLPHAPSAIGGQTSLFHSLTGAVEPGATTVLLALSATGVLVTLAATLAFRRSERRAKDLGLIDRTTGS